MDRIDFQIAKLTVDDIAALNETSTLYLIDFRATGETLEHEIDDMFIYENLSQWLRSMNDENAKGFYAVNSENLQRSDLPSDNLILAKAQDKASVALATRIHAISRQVSSLWVGVPHPASDKLAARRGLEVNYKYEDFLSYNDKLTQKKLLEDLTPSYFEIKTADDFKRTLGQAAGFIKSSLGAGGYSVFNVQHDRAKISEKQNKILSARENWYFEAAVNGAPKSVQLYKTGNKFTLFGFARQNIIGTNFVGADLLDIDRGIAGYAKETLVEACQRIAHLLDSYEGFLGIDFIDSGEAISILEVKFA